MKRQLCLGYFQHIYLQIFQNLELIAKLIIFNPISQAFGKLAKHFFVGQDFTKNLQATILKKVTFCAR
jgi:hypothetical protein